MSFILRYFIDEDEPVLLKVVLFIQINAIRQVWSSLSCIGPMRSLPLESLSRASYIMPAGFHTGFFQLLE